MSDSNFYIKLHTGLGTDINIPIESDALWTKCPVCGKEHKVTLDAVIDPETLCLQHESYVGCGNEKCEEKILQIARVQNLRRQLKEAQ